MFRCDASLPRANPKAYSESLLFYYASQIFIQDTFGISNEQKTIYDRFLWRGYPYVDRKVLFFHHGNRTFNWRITNSDYLTLRKKL